MTEESLLDLMLRLRRESQEEESSSTVEEPEYEQDREAARSPELDPRHAELIQMIQWIGQEDPLALTAIQSLEREPGNPYSRDYSSIRPLHDLYGSNVLEQYNISKDILGISDSFWFPWGNLIDENEDPVRNPNHGSNRLRSNRYAPEDAGVFTFQPRDEQLYETLSHGLRHMGTDTLFGNGPLRDHRYIYQMQGDLDRRRNPNAGYTETQREADSSMSRTRIAGQRGRSTLENAASSYRRNRDKLTNEQFDSDSDSDSTALTGAANSESFLRLLDLFSRALEREQE